NKGTYNQCASACRHDPTMQNCTEMCIAVCTLTNLGEYTEIASGASYTPSIGDYRIVLDYIPVDSQLLVIGEINGSTISGGSTFIVSNKGNDELLSDLKSSETAQYWGMKIGSFI